MSRYEEIRLEKGRKAGEAWARSEAGRSDLARLQEFVDNTSEGLATFADYFDREVDAPHSHAEYIAMAIIDHDAATDDDHEVYEAAISIFGENYDNRSPEYLAGFVESALGVLAEWEHKATKSA